MEKLQKIASKEYPIRFQDRDPFSHLNNSKYLDYFVNAREDLSKDVYKIDLTDLALNKGLGWVVSEHNIAYLRPAKMSEIVIIEAQLIKHTNKSLKFEMRMWNHNKTVLKSVNWTELVHVNIALQKPIDHNVTLENVFNQIELPVFETHFDERVAFFKNFNRK